VYEKKIHVKINGLKFKNFNEKLSIFYTYYFYSKHGLSKKLSSILL